MFSSKGRSAIVAAVAFLLLGLGPGTSVITGLSQQSAFYYNASGTYSGSLLPKWCVNAHTATASGAQNVTLMQTVGAQCARVDATNWDQVELSPGVYTWTGSDPLWNAVCGAGIQPIFVAAYNNTLYGAASVFTTISGSTQINGYSNYTVAVLNRLVGTNGCVNPIAELFNEPNLTQWTTSTWTGSAYIGVATTTAAAAKAAQPSATVITGGASPGTGTVPPQLWLGGAVGSSPTLTNISGYGLHPYAYNEGTPSLTPLPATQLATDTLAFSRVAASGVGGGTNKPIYITEYGFTLQAFGSAPSTCAAPSTCQTQGLYLAYGMLTAVPLFVPYFVQYDLVDDGTSYSASDQNTFGMFYNGSASSGNPVTGATAYGIKPQGQAFQSITGCTAGATSFNLSYDTTLNVETEAFNKSTGKCFAVFTWDASGTKSYSATIGAFSSVTCKDVFGNSFACTYSGGVLSASISTTTGPLIATAAN